MYRTGHLFILATFCSAESMSDLVTASPCFTTPHIRCHQVEQSAQQDVLLNRLEALKNRTEYEHVGRRVEGTSLINQQRHQAPEFRRVHRRAADRHRVLRNSNDLQLVIPPPVPADRLVTTSVRADKLVIPPPLPTLAERQELLLMNDAHIPGKKRGKAIDPKKLQRRRDQSPLHTTRSRAYQSSRASVPSQQSDGDDDGVFMELSKLTDRYGIYHRPRSRSPFSRPGLWEGNPDNPHNRDHANKFWYHPSSLTVDWMNGQIGYGDHFAVPAVGVGLATAYSSLHFPSVGRFLGIADDYDI